jgi:hypothetical protein
MKLLARSHQRAVTHCRDKKTFRKASCGNQALLPGGTDYIVSPRDPCSRRPGRRALNIMPRISGATVYYERCPTPQGFLTPTLSQLSHELNVTATCARQDFVAQRKT